VLAQSWPGWELVLADDGSDDGTADVAERLGDPRIKVLRLPHRGLRALAETYNAALAAGSGPLVAVLEADDLWPKDKLEVQVRGFDDADVVLSWGAGLHVDAQGALLREVRFAPRGTGDVRLLAPELFRLLLTRDVLVPTASLMLRRDALLAAGGFVRSGATHYVDLPTWLRVLARHPEAAAKWHDHLLGSWRRHGAQTTERHTSTMDRQRWRVVRNAARAAGPEALAALGFTAGDARENRARRAIACGRAALAGGRHGRARRLFAAALRAHPSVRRRAVVGFLSALLRFDASAAWRRARGRERRRLPPEREGP
jgi:glycosyltransferase involved in cell wall biosynthesis